MKKYFAIAFVRPFIRREIPGWGKLYAAFVGDYVNDDMWASTTPVILRDKRYNMIRILDLRKWSDRIFYFLDRWYDLPTQLVAEAFVKKGNHVLDVGANYGHFALSAASIVGETGRVDAFEPNPVVYSRLVQHISLNDLSHVTPHNLGAADQEMTLELNVPRVNSGEGTFGKSEYEDKDVISCQVRRLDDVMRGSRIDFIKIDVEGFEVNALKGAQEIIEQQRPIILTEIVNSHLENAGSSTTELHQFFRKADYVPFGVSQRRAGLAHVLSLSRVDDGGFKDPNDYLWFPVSRTNEAESYLSSHSKIPK
ncbi:MAG: FkbM family methyltransferase [Paracoccaceae bacterium]